AEFPIWLFRAGDIRGNLSPRSRHDNNDLGFPGQGTSRPASVMRRVRAEAAGYKGLPAYARRGAALTGARRRTPDSAPALDQDQSLTRAVDRASPRGRLHIRDGGRVRAHP